MLDGPTQGQPTSTAPASLDAETLAAMERNREIAEAQKQPLDSSVTTKTLNDPLLKFANPARTLDPVVAAAESYAESQRVADAAVARVGLLDSELKQARAAAAEAANDRDAKKVALQKLVAS